MKSRKNRVILTVTALLSLVALVTGSYVAQHLHLPKKIDSSQFHGTYLQQPRAIHSFSLVGTDQKTYTDESLKGHWTMVFFGFTQCGYLCPTTMAELGKMYRLLEQKGVKTLPEVVMISIDPKRDSLEKLGQYVTSFDTHFYGARGQDEMVKAMTREMGIAYYKVAPPGNSVSEDYDMQHSGAVMLFNPKGELNAFFTTPHHAELLAKDYLLLVS